MDLEKLTKSELIEKLEEQKHLAKAVEAKDIEISRLSGINLELEKTTKKLLAEIESQKHLAKAVETKDAELVKLKESRAQEIANVKDGQEKIKLALEYELQDLREKVSKLPDVEKLQEAYKNAVEYNNELILFINAYKMSIKNYLMVQQGALDNMIELEALQFEKIQNKNKGVK